MKAKNPLGYSLNVFPDETMPQLWRTLQEQAVSIQQSAFGEERFPVEMRFSDGMAQELSRDAAQRKKLGEFLRANKLELMTLNAFVPLSFHEPNVKEKVYLPRWDEGNERLEYTKTCATLLAELGSAREQFLSLSVPAGVLKRDTSEMQRPLTDAAFAVNLARYVAHARQLEMRTGRRCVIALEAEPGLTCELTTELIEFFHRSLDVFGAGWLVRNGVNSLQVARALLRRYVGVNFDTCHQLVEGEDLRASVEQLWAMGIAIFKIHVSNCLQIRNPAKKPKEVAALRKIYAKSKFLHQTIAFEKNRTEFALDLPEVFTTERRPCFCGGHVHELRSHYHMPLLAQRGRVPTMLGEVREFVRWFIRQSRARGCPLIIETYTWLEQLGRRGVERDKELRQNITRELAEVHAWL